MAYSIQGLDPNGSGSRGGVKIGTYLTADTFAVVETDGYFDSVSSVFTTGDSPWVQASEGTRLCQITSTTDDIALTPIFTDVTTGVVTTSSDLPFFGSYDLISTGAQTLQMADPVVGSSVLPAKSANSTPAIDVTISSSTRITTVLGNRALKFDVKGDTALLVCVAALKVAVIVGSQAPGES